MKFTKFSVAVFLFVIASNASSGPFEAQMKRVCPDDWQLTTKEVPVITSSLNPWGGADDKNTVKEHLSRTELIKTLDKEVITSDDLVNDLLTVASECLVYRNFEVDGHGPFIPPEEREPVEGLGWLPAAIF